MHNVGIVVNYSKDKNLNVTRAIVKWIEDRNGNIMLTEKASDMIGRRELGFSLNDIYSKSDFVIVLGGDGTILGAARDAAMYETPLLGVNMGHLGFLAEVEVKNLYDSLEYLFSNSIETQKRLMLQASLCSNNVCRNFFALNDISITRGTLSRVISLQVLIDDDFVTSISGDGIVLATPTGSTAYSLSAGGPVVSPALSAITITPICPHSFSNRSIVISDSETVRIDLNEGSSDAYLTIDGQEGYKIEVGDIVHIKSAPFKTNLIKLSGRSFYDVLRTKLSER